MSTQRFMHQSRLPKQIRRIFHVPTIEKLTTQAALALITTFGVLGSPTAWAETQSYDFSSFDGVSIAEGIHVQITSGSTFEVISESEDAQQLEYLNLEAKRGILSAQMDDGLLSPNWVRGDKAWVIGLTKLMGQVLDRVAVDFCNLRRTTWIIMWD